METGSIVIAHVPIDNELQWMLSEVQQFFPDRQQCQIIDLVPDEQSKPELVSIKDVRKYPHEPTKIQAGDRFMCIWNDGTEWLSVLYPCLALESYENEKTESLVVKVKFDGVSQVEYVNASWLISVD